MRREACVPSPLTTGQGKTLNGKTLIDALDLKHIDERWAFAERERTRIDAHWRELVAANPALLPLSHGAHDQYNEARRDRARYFRFDR